MTEQVPWEAAEHVEPDLEDPTSEDAEDAEDTDDLDERDPSGPGEPVRTGVAAVDDVLVEVDRLDEAPLAEHLESFERAHHSLRTALDADPGEPA